MTSLHRVDAVAGRRRREDRDQEQHRGQRFHEAADDQQDHVEQ
jgi:hypothetical protein